MDTFKQLYINGKNLCSHYWCWDCWNCICLFLQKSFPNLSYRIIESRNSVGGTWDQMRFPGVRADNDMYTYGFSFDPWNGSIIGNGQEIKNLFKSSYSKV